MTIGESIRKVRKELGMNQTEFASDCGVSVGILRKWEIDEQAPSWTMILRIIDVCGVDWLIECLEEMR